MSEDPPAFADRELAPLLDQLVHSNAEVARALLLTSHQAIAGMVTNALLVRELGRARLVDIEALRAEAIVRAIPLGSAVVVIIQNIFGGEPPRTPGSGPSAFQVIHGGRVDV